MRPVFAHGVAPLGMRDAGAAGHLRAAVLAVPASRELPLMTTEYGRDGTRIELLSKWLVVGRSESRRRITGRSWRAEPGGAGAGALR
jgi:hypothetical protein